MKVTIWPKQAREGQTIEPYVQVKGKLAPCMLYIYCLLVSVNL